MYSVSSLFSSQSVDSLQPQCFLREDIKLSCIYNLHTSTLSYQITYFTDFRFIDLSSIPPVIASRCNPSCNYAADPVTHYGRVQMLKTHFICWAS